MANPTGRPGPTTPGRMKTSPKKRKLCRVAIARCAATRSIDLSQGQMVPAGTVENEDGVYIGWQRGGKPGEKQVHHGGIDEGQHQGEVLAGGGADGREDVGPLVALLGKAGGALAPQPPAVTHPSLVADARFVLEPQLQALAGMRLGRRVQGRA